MKGSFKRDDTKDTAEMLRVQVAELEKRKKGLQSEISIFYRNHKSKLDLEYNTLISKHEKEYKDRVSELDKRENAIKKGEASLSSQKSTSEASVKAIQVAANKKVRELDSLIKENNNKIEDMEIEYKGKKADIDKKSADIVSERESIKKNEKALKDAQASIVILQKQNKEESIRLNNLIREYEGKINYIDFQKIEINEQTKALDDREFIISEDEIEIERRLSNAKEVERKAKATMDATNQVAEANDREDARLKAEAIKLKSLTVSLRDLRNTLDEKDITLNEKDRFLILKGRTIDGKIRILKELRKNKEK